MTRELRPLFAPRSVAVVGASADPSKWGNVLARGVGTAAGAFVVGLGLAPRRRYDLPRPRADIDIPSRSAASPRVTAIG